MAELREAIDHFRDEDPLWIYRGDSANYASDGDSFLQAAWSAARNIEQHARTGNMPREPHSEAILESELTGVIDPNAYSNLQVRCHIDELYTWATTTSPLPCNPDLGPSESRTTVAATTSGIISAPSPKKSANGATFKRLNSTWMISFGDQSATVKHNVGFERISKLLSQPHRSLTAAELIGNDSRTQAIATPPADSILDAEAVEAFRKRLVEIVVERDRATAANDTAKLNECDREAETIGAELNAATGAFGKSRALQQNQDITDRKTVSTSLQRGLSILSEHGLDGLAAHLKNYIDRSGDGFVYEPGDNGPEWDITIS